MSAGGTVHVQPVTLGPTDGDNVQVVSGLDEGDRVVTDGADRLREGAHVTVASAGPDHGAAGGSGAASTAGPAGADEAGHRRGGPQPGQARQGQP